MNPFIHFLFSMEALLLGLLTIFLGWFEN